MERSSRPEVFRKKSVLRKLKKSTGKYLCQSLFFHGPIWRIPYSVFLGWHRIYHVQVIVPAAKKQQVFTLRLSN